MENTDNGNTGTAAGLEPADGGSEGIDLGGLSRDECLASAETALERASDQLTYGRRQEGEAAQVLIEQARLFIQAARAAGEG